MDELARQFCREAGRRCGLRYSSELRRAAVEYAATAERKAWTQRQIAEALGLCEAT